MEVKKRSSGKHRDNDDDDERPSREEEEMTQCAVFETTATLDARIRNLRKFFDEIK